MTLAGNETQEMGIGLQEKRAAVEEVKRNQDRIFGSEYFFPKFRINWTEDGWAEFLGFQ